MNTLDDLRRTLDQHAEDVADPATVARTASVHHRVAAVRRRRRTAGAGALALALVAGIGVALLPRGDGSALPAAPVVLGDRAPTTVHSLGYTYRTDGTAESGTRQVRVAVAKSDQPQLFSWTTQGATDVQVTLPGDEVRHSHRTGFRDFVVVPPGQSGRLQASVAAGRVALAHYVLTSHAPVGYTRDGVTFRQSVAGTSLLGAAMAEPGATEATTTVVAPRGQVGIALLCSGLPSADDIQVTFDGRPGIAGGCGGSDGTFDPGADASFTSRIGRPGRTITVRVFVSKGDAGSTAVPAPVPGLRLGVGLYAPLHEQPLAGYRVADAIELDGHLWRLSRTYRSAGAPLRIPGVAEDRTAWMVWGDIGSTMASFAVDGQTAAGGRIASPGGGGIGGLWVPAGSGATASTRHDRGPFGIALYTRAD